MTELDELRARLERLRSRAPARDRDDPLRCARCGDTGWVALVTGEYRRCYQCDETELTTGYEAVDPTQPRRNP